jgi:hypothetical protein
MRRFKKKAQKHLEHINNGGSVVNFVKGALNVEIDSLSQVNCLKTEPLEFFRQVLRVEPTDYQKELIELFQKNQFAAAR